MDSRDPRRILALRLRELREHHWPERRITQPQLAKALGGGKPLSVPLISSWESHDKPRIPPLYRLESYAALFATIRSCEGAELHLISPEDMDDEEKQAMQELQQELIQLRNNALRASSAAVEPARSSLVSQVRESLSAGPWRFADGNRIAIVCAQWPPHMLESIPYTDKEDPDYIELLNYSELDALFELHGHLRAFNPENLVNRRTVSTLSADDYSSHLASLGGVDWNELTSAALEQLTLPVRQVAEWDTPGGQYFEVEDNGKTVRHHPNLDGVSDHSKGILRSDVSLFARAVNPFNHKRTLTICNGMYGRGTLGVVRALTDAAFRDRNADYLRSRFGDSETYCILTRVMIANNGETLTPDWTAGNQTLFEWSR